MSEIKELTREEALESLANEYGSIVNLNKKDDGTVELKPSSNYQEIGNVEGDPLSAGAISAGLGAPVGLFQQRQLAKNPKASVTISSPTIVTESEAKPSRRVVGSSGAANWTRAMGNVPEVIAEQAENMRSNNPKGGQFLINKDIENVNKIQSIGEGNKKLYTLPNGTQLMLSPEDIMRLELEEKKLQESKLPNRIMKGITTANKFVNKVPMLSTPLAAFGMGSLGQEFANRQQANDSVGKYIAGAGAIGSGLSLVPYPPAQIVGRGLAMASPLALYAYDKYINPPK